MVAKWRQSTPGGKGGAAAPESILVVEDEDDIRELLRYNLAQEGYRVLGAVSGEEALKTVRAGLPNLCPFLRRG